MFFMEINSDLYPGANFFQAFVKANCHPRTTLLNIDGFKKLSSGFPPARG